MGRISRGERKWGLFPECRTPKGFVHLEFMARRGMVHYPFGEPIHEPLLDKASPENGIRGVPTPSSAIGGYPDLGS